MATVHGFATSNSLGQLGEQVAVSFLRQSTEWCQAHLLHSVEAQTRLNIDMVATRLCRNPRHTHRTTLDVKTDMVAATSGNIALEIRHDYRNGETKSGWLWRTTAGFLLHIVTRREHLADPSDLRPARIVISDVAVLRRLAASWVSEHPTYESLNARYKTRGILVPLVKFTTAISCVGDYEVHFKRSHDGVLRVYGEIIRSRYLR